MLLPQLKTLLPTPQLMRQLALESEKPLKKQNHLRLFSKRFSIIKVQSITTISFLKHQRRFARLNSRIN